MVIVVIVIGSLSHFTPMNIQQVYEMGPKGGALRYTIEDFVNLLNGTPEGRLIRDSMATLPINELGFRNAKPIGLRPQLNGNPPKEDCPICQDLRILHRCK